MSGVVVIKSENGPVRLDASEFKPGEHELHVADETHDEHGVRRAANHAATEIVPTVFEYVAAGYSAMTYAKRFSNPKSSPEEIAAAIKAQKAAEQNDPANPQLRNYDQFGVMQKKDKFYIVDGANGGKIVDEVEGIDPKGYASNQDAWGVLLALKAGNNA